MKNGANRLQQTFPLMDKLFTSTLKLGIIAGGQLGKMLIQEASKWDIATYVLDEDPQCPAASIATGHVNGSLSDYRAVYEFGKMVDILTYEIESINIDALFALKKEGLHIMPDPSILELIQDKGLQKEFYAGHQIPTASFTLFETRQQIIEATQQGRLAFPFVQKLRKGGYDGRGVCVINTADDLDELLKGPSVIEEKIAIDKEIAVIAARNNSGEIKCFPVVEMVFDARANLVEELICPSVISEPLAREAQQVAASLIGALGLCGLLAVEFFVDINGKLLVNESAPRPHNSGHHTIESVITSQFEQHLRAILNLPLGSIHMKMPAVMINLLGEEGNSGPVVYHGLAEAMAIEGVNVHLYGKKITRPFRKMGHVTIIAPNMREALERADRVKNLIKVRS